MKDTPYNEQLKNYLDVLKVRLIRNVETTPKGLEERIKHHRSLAVLENAYLTTLGAYSIEAHLDAKEYASWYARYEIYKEGKQ